MFVQCKWVVSHNSRNLYRISKVGTEIPFNAPILCTKFQLDPSVRSHFIAIFLSVQKDEKKTNLNETLGTRILNTAGAICVNFGM